MGLMARWRWYWVPPLYALALIFLLIVTLTRSASTAQFMYNKFEFGLLFHRSALSTTYVRR